MSIHIGYVTLPTGTYDAWRNATNGEGFNFDSSYGCQCYDLAAEFWWNVGFPPGYPIIDQSSAYRMWYYRDQNVAYGGITYFDLVYNLSDVKRGDVMVFNYTSYNQFGHVAWADVDYASWTPDPSQPYEFPVLSQNNGGTPDPQGGAITNIHGYDIRLFIGAFRYKPWETTPPTPPTPTTKAKTEKKFPWVLYANKLRNKY